jgi:hypothetical protein
MQPKPRTGMLADISFFGSFSWAVERLDQSAHAHSRFSIKNRLRKKAQTVQDKNIQTTEFVRLS